MKDAAIELIGFIGTAYIFGVWQKSIQAGMFMFCLLTVLGIMRMNIRR